jgi:hypothetical protein
MPCPQQTQKVLSAFTVRAFEPGKVVIANMGGVAIFALMPSARVVHRHHAGGFQSRPQNPLLLFEKRLMAFGEQDVDLTGRNIDTPFAQLLQQ